MTRSQSRKNAFLLLFQQPINDVALDEVLENISAAEQSDIEVDEFCKELLSKTFDSLIFIDHEIETNLKGWSIKRIPKISLAVLRLSCAQLMYMPEIPGSVIINEAVELAKEFGGDDEFSFVNGVLRSVYTATRGEESN